MSAKAKKTNEAAATPTEGTGTELLSLEALKPEEVFKGEGVKGLLETVKKQIVFKHEPDTEEGREERRSLAYKIARTKTGVDNMGKDYVAKIKAVASVIDEKRRDWRQEMESLQDEVRRPLTEYEEKEKARIAGHQDSIQKMRDLMNFDYEPGSADIEARIEEVTEIGGRNYEEFAAQADTVKENTLGRLSEKLAHAIKVEEQAKELEDLRKKQTEQAEKDRIAEAERQAEARAKEKAQADIDAANQRAADAEKRAAQATADAEAEAEKKRNAEAEEEKRRAADKEHKRGVNKKILDALVDECMITESAAKAVITAIVSGKVPNTKITY